MRRLPEKWKRALIIRIKLKMEGQYAEPEDQIEKRAESFLLKEGMLILWGMFLLAVVLAGTTAYQFCESKEVILERNSFGDGEKEVSVLLKRGEEKQKYCLVLEEQKLSSSEEKELKKEFFSDLEQNLAGENFSLKRVNKTLSFDESIKGWPFYITYEPEDHEVIRIDGSLEDWNTISEYHKNHPVNISVTAEYDIYRWKKIFPICLAEPESPQKQSSFDKAAAVLKKWERKTRSKKMWTAPAAAGDVMVEEDKEINLFGVFLFGIGIVSFLALYNAARIKEGEEKCRKETRKDFPVIVHLLALYMGAGLSLSSAIQRIGEDYSARQSQRKRFAFEEVLWMGRQIRLGAGQQEICAQWGRKFKEPAYQKLSMTLSQVISKGTKEGRVLMEQMEQEAFRKRIDQAKKEGEEAATKLLFPMILLLCMSMLFVMFPAIVRFQGF